MAKVQSPLLGYNTNVRHKGRVFHIQTEDSGIKKPHVITHLFADGGRILKSVKKSYADLVEADDLATQVKKLMQDQHKAMFIALRDGAFDSQVGPVVDTSISSDTIAALDAEGTIEIDESQFLDHGETAAAPVPEVVEPPRAAPSLPPPLRKITSATPAVVQSTAASVTVPTATETTPFVAPSVPQRAPLRAAPRAAVTAHATDQRPKSRRPPSGEHMVHERSLDDVILAYLAEELAAQ
jgi:hypothetical protein